MAPALVGDWALAAVEWLTAADLPAEASAQAGALVVAGGLGWRRFSGYYPAPALPKREETELLAQEAEGLEEELKAIKARLAELKGQK